jgi:hypothetical protein
MWQADEAWRAALRVVTFAELGKTLEQDIDPAIWAGTFDWVLKRAG